MGNDGLKTVRASIIRKVVNIDTIYGDTICMAANRDDIMPLRSKVAKEHSRTEQPAPLEDMAFVDAVRMLLNAFEQLREKRRAGGHDPLKDFGEACRMDLRPGNSFSRDHDDNHPRG
jgi:hypothetical protein